MKMKMSSEDSYQSFYTWQSLGKDDHAGSELEVATWT